MRGGGGRSWSRKTLRRGQVHSPTHPSPVSPHTHTHTRASDRLQGSEQSGRTVRTERGASQGVFKNETKTLKDLMTGVQSLRQSPDIEYLSLNPWTRSKWRTVLKVTGKGRGSVSPPEEANPPKSERVAPERESLPVLPWNRSPARGDFTLVPEPSCCRQDLQLLLAC